MTHAPDGDYAGWHLLGNPFASAIDWTAGDWQRQHILGGPKIWDSEWSSYSPVIDIIPAMSGFMVFTEGNGSLRIPPEARVHQAVQESEQLAKTGNPTAANASPDHPRTDHPDRITLRAYDPAGQTAQTTIIFFRNEASLFYDPLYDTPFMEGHAPSFWSQPALTKGSSQHATPPRLALNNLPYPDGQVSIPLGFQKKRIHRVPNPGCLRPATP